MGRGKRHKSAQSGKFLSKEDAEALLAAEALAFATENSDPNIGNQQHRLVVPFGENRGGSRRAEVVDGRTAEKIRRLERDLAAERERSKNLKTELDQRANDIIQARNGAGTKLQALIEKAAHANMEQKEELIKVKDQHRKAKQQVWKMRSQAAARAKEAAKRVQKKLYNRRRARKTQVADTKVVKTCVPPPSFAVDDRRRYDYIRYHAAKLEAWFVKTFSDGSTGESALEVLTFFLDLRSTLARDIMIKLEIPTAIEAEVVRSLQASLSVEKAAAIRSSTGMTWDGYRQFAKALFTEWDPVACTETPMDMPFGGKPPQAPRTHTLMKHENEIYKEFGLDQSLDGVVAWCDVKKLLELRLSCFPDEQLAAVGEAGIHLFFGADAFRLHKHNNTKAVLCVCKPLLERKGENDSRLEGWAVNSKDNNLKMALYEGSDCYSEFTTKGSITQKMLAEIHDKGLDVKGTHYKAKVGLFGDMAFLDSILGGSGCGSDRPCILCDVHTKHLMWKKETFQDEGVEAPKEYTMRERTMLSHAFGAAYGITQPYECPGCHKVVSRHCQHPPITTAEQAAYRKEHRHQQHGRPPPQLPLEDIVACSMHGEHNILAQTWYASVQQQLWDKDITDKVTKIVNEDWKMKRFKITRNTGKKAQTKDSPHFNGPEGKIVCARRAEVLAVVAPPTHQDHQLIIALWEAQDKLFEIWRRPAPADANDWGAAGDEAQEAAESYVDLFTLLAGASDGTVTMHYAMFHWPEHIRKWGSLAGINAQGLEAGNQECKGDSKTHSNRQTVRILQNGTWSRGRAAQLLAKSITRQIARVRATSQKQLVRHVRRTPIVGNQAG